MSILKCKMCGETLNVNEDDKIIICKLCGTSQTIPNSNDNNDYFTINQNSKIKNLIRRIHILLEDDNYKKADELIDQIFIINPECAEAYLLLVLIQYQISKEEDLLLLPESLDNNKNFSNALKFANDEYKEKLLSYNESIKKRLATKKLDNIYLLAKKLYDNKRYELAIDVFENIKDYKDSQIYLNKCKEILEEIKKERICKDIFLSLDSLINNSKNSINEEEFNNLITKLDEYKDFNDINLKINEYHEKYKYKKEEIEQLKIKEENDRLEKIKQEKIKKDKRKKFLKFFIPSFVVSFTLSILIFTLFIPLSKYNNALELINKGEYDKAEEILENLGDFKDCDKQIKLIEARDYFDNGNYEDGIEVIYEVGGTVNISYDLDGGTAEKSSEVIKKSRRIDNLCEKEGYNFYGWNLESYKFSNDNYVVDLNLKAMFELISYELTFELDGGQIQNQFDSYTIIDDISIPNPSKKGHTFLGWSLGRDDELIKDLVIEKGSVGNRDYIAHWEVNTYTITLNYGDTSESIQVEYGSEVTLKTLSNDKYDFLGWIDEYGNLFENGIYEIDNNLILEAKWEPTKFNIYYLLDGGYNNLNNPAYFTYEDDYIQLSNPTKEGYKFLGWTGTDFEELTFEVYIPANSYENKTFIAYWEAETYDVSFDVDGGSELTSTAYEFDTNIVLPIPTKNGYKFDGWYYFGVKINDGIWKIPNNATLYAKWTVVEYTISYSLHGGTNNSENPKKYTIESENIVLKSPEKAGYIFLGWTGEGFEEPTKDIIIPTNSTENKSFLAHWEADEFEVRFDVNGGNLSDDDPIYIIFNNSFILPSPTMNCADFLGWYYENKIVDTEKWNIPNDCTLVAKWKYYFTYEVVDNQVVITGLDKSVSNLILPDKINNMDVVKIENNAFKNNEDIVNVSIPDTVYYIGYMAFYNCNNLISIYISENVEYLGEYCFSSCSSLVDININANINKLPDNCFSGCISLKNITLSDNITEIGKSAFTVCWDIEEIYLPTNLTKIDERAFYGCAGLKYIFIPNSVYSIESGAFLSCTSLTTIDLPSSLNCINSSVFYNCTELKYIYLPDSVTYIGTYAFQGCKNLESITIPERLSSIHEGAFANCTSLNNVFYNGSLENWYNFYFASESPNQLSIANHFYYYDEQEGWVEIKDIEKN